MDSKGQQILCYSELDSPVKYEKHKFENRSFFESYGRPSHGSQSFLRQQI